MEKILDDITFVFILAFHQLCFLYYIQMNCKSNYLLKLEQLWIYKNNHSVKNLVKKYTKATRLLVKVNKQFMKKTTGFLLYK